MCCRRASDKGDPLGMCNYAMALLASHKGRPDKDQKAEAERLLNKARSLQCQDAIDFLEQRAQEQKSSGLMGKLRQIGNKLEDDD